jgi:type I restriction enzyme S subunit
MNPKWKRVRLDELTQADSPITYGVVKPGDPGDVLFIRGGDLAGGRVLDNQLRTITSEVSKQYRRTLLRGGELLICLVGQPGQVAVAPPALAGANIARQVGLIRLRSEVDAEFISYFLQSPNGQANLGTYTGGSVQQVINLGDLRTVNVPIPPLPEQQRIVGILDEAFEGIATAKANAEKNLQNARALFESHLHAIFTKRGEGWVDTTLGEACENLDSKRVPITKNKRVAGDYPYYGASGIVDYVNDYLFDEDLLLVSEDGANLLARTYPIAFSVSGKVWVNNHAHVLRFPDHASQRFMEFYLNSIKLDPYVSGMAQPKLNQKALNSIPVPSPPLPQRKAIVANLDSLQEETQRLESIYQQKLDALDDLKKSLLHQAFSGELTAGHQA